MSDVEEQVVTVEVDVKAEDDAPDHADVQQQPEEEEGETAPAETQQQEEEEEPAATQDGEDSGSDDEKEAAGKRKSFTQTGKKSRLRDVPYQHASSADVGCCMCCSAFLFTSCVVKHVYFHFSEVVPVTSTEQQPAPEAAAADVGEGEGQQEREGEQKGEGEQEGEVEQEGEGEQKGEGEQEGEGEQKGEGEQEGEGEQKGERQEEGEGQEEGVTERETLPSPPPGVDIYGECVIILRGLVVETAMLFILISQFGRVISIEYIAPVELAERSFICTYNTHMYVYIHAAI